jgi:hypothetical protein
MDGEIRREDSGESGSGLRHLVRDQEVY